jgi:hypothetical protein
MVHSTGIHTSTDRSTVHVECDSEDDTETFKLISEVIRRDPCWTLQCGVRERNSIQHEKGARVARHLISYLFTIKLSRDKP